MPWRRSSGRATSSSPNHSKIPMMACVDSRSRTPTATFCSSVARAHEGGVMTESDLKFEWYDAWILAALVWATEEDAPVPLWRLIGTADALNKAVVSRGELECGIGRLVSAGFVCVVPDGFKATPRALALKGPGPPMEIVSRAIGPRER